MTETPPHKRRVNTVFQSYALFPHLTVAENVGFGLRFRSFSTPEKESRVGEMLELVRLGGFGKRKPHELSGGQQQRVALARALILSPDVLLLDEPLGALDAKLRRELQVELKSIQREVGITFLYVTHDQEEALTMSDRLAVMAERPRRAARHLRGRSTSVPRRRSSPTSSASRTSCGPSRADRPGRRRRRSSLAVSTPMQKAGVVRVAIRPERVRIEARGASGENRVPARIERFVYLGSTTQVFVTLPGGDRLQALVANDEDVEEYDVGAGGHRVPPARRAARAGRRRGGGG